MKYYHEWERTFPNVLVRKPFVMNPLRVETICFMEKKPWIEGYRSLMRRLKCFHVTVSNDKQMFSRVKLYIIILIITGKVRY